MSKDAYANGPKHRIVKRDLHKRLIYIQRNSSKKPTRYVKYVKRDLQKRPVNIQRNQLAVLTYFDVLEVQKKCQNMS